MGATIDKDLVVLLATTLALVLPVLVGLFPVPVGLFPVAALGFGEEGVGAAAVDGVVGGVEGVGLVRWVVWMVDGRAGVCVCACV